MPKFHCKHPSCQKFFMSEDHLEAHYRTHFGLLPFVCPFPGCGKTFSLNGNMKSHFTTHDATRCFACPFPGCEKRFKRARKLEDHTYEAHSKSLRQQQQQQQQHKPQERVGKEDDDDSEGSPSSSSPDNLIDDVAWKQREEGSQGAARGKIRPRSEEVQQPEFPRKHAKLVSVSTGLPPFSMELIGQFPGYPQPVTPLDSYHPHPHQHPHYPRVNTYGNGYVTNVNYPHPPYEMVPMTTTMTTTPGSEPLYWPTWPTSGAYAEEASYDRLYVEERE